MLEDLPRWHRYHARPDAIGTQLLVRLDGKTDLASGGDQDDVGLPPGAIGEDVGQRLPRQCQDCGHVAELHDVAVRLDDLVGVGRPQGDQPGDGAQRGELLHGLMRWPILAVAHGVVREDEDRGKLHHGREPDGGARVVAEDEERRPERPELRQRKPIHDRGHPVLADAEVQVLSAGTPGLEIPRPLVRQRGPVRGRKVRRPAEEPGHVLSEHVEDLTRSVPPGHALRIGREDGKILVPIDRQLAPLHQIDFVGECSVLRAIGFEQTQPPIPRGGAARAHPGREMLVHAVGDEELGVLGPSVKTLGETDLIVAQRLAMGLGRVVLVRRAVADVAVDDDERGTPFRALEDLEGARDTIHVVGVVHALHVPAVTHEPPGHVLRERQACAALDGDAVVVVDPAQVVETQVAGQ